MLFSSKKAMSPLIATVLLIAFAVALGAMIMNWSADAVVDNSVDLATACASVKIQNNGNICYADGKLTFNVKNVGKARINAVRIKSSSEIGDLELAVKDSSMINGEALERSIPFIYSGGGIELDFLPLVNYDGDLVECEGFSQTSLATC
ncbi:hypothetical protein JXA48_02630 [Candidatus Woesearchaeota archaeon]|nr:hypothetical protein [Candidatus Woesearchaeota archaeon]